MWVEPGMIAILQWGTLIICSRGVFRRRPDAIQGRNRTVFGILVLATLCSLLLLSGPDEAIDAALGGRNLAHLILRFLVFAAVLLVGLRVARGLGDPARLPPHCRPDRTLDPGRQQCRSGGDLRPHGHPRAPRWGCLT